MTEDKVLVVYLPDCHESIAGIIAGRIKERYYRPTFVITNAEDGAKGSGRSIEGYNMAEELNKCKNLLTKYGGHPMAAGLSYISMGLVEQLKLLEPFGKGNEKPVFADRDLYVKKADIIGANKNVLRMQLETKDGCLMNAVQFNVNEGDKIPEAGSSILVVYYPDRFR